MDVNCCIKSVLEVEGIKDYYKEPINRFLECCSKREIVLGYFPIIREMAERYLSKALEDLLGQRNVKLNQSERYRAFNKVKDKLRKLFEIKLKEFKQDFTKE